MKHLRPLLLALLIGFPTAQGLCNEIPGDSTASGPVTKGFYLGTTTRSTAGSCWGVNVGGYANFHLTNLLGLQLDLGYVTEGSLIRSSSDARLDYVQFAVLARFDQPRSPYRDEYNFRPKLMGGLALNTRVKTRTHRLGEENEHFFQHEALSLIFGGGFDHHVWSRRAITFEFRFDLDLSDVRGGWISNTAHFLVGMTL
jgi:hypothetical protein